MRFYERPNLRVAGRSLNIDAPLSWWSVWQTEWRRSLFVPPPALFYPFLLVLPSLPSLPLLSLSSFSVLVIHRVDASQLNLTEPLNHGTCHNSFLPLFPSSSSWTELNYKCLIFNLLPLLRRCGSDWISSLEARRILRSSNQPGIRCTLSRFISPHLSLSENVQFFPFAKI